MEISTEQVATAPPSADLGEAFRHMAARWDDPLSGEGARIRGGRFDPPDSFPVLYLCTTRPCAAAELRHLGERHVIGVEALLPRVLHRYEVSLDRVLDLTSAETLDHIGVSTEEIVGADLGIPRQIGEAAHATGSQAIRAPSAAGVDDVLAVFPELLGGGRLLAEVLERWESSEDLRAERGPGRARRNRPGVGPVPVVGGAHRPIDWVIQSFAQALPNASEVYWVPLSV